LNYLLYNPPKPTWLQILLLLSLVLNPQL
jgi:hypothetical protein